MPHSDFVHLHTHTQYSLLDGACQLKKLVNLAKNYKMPSLAITDHGNMFGAIEFYLEAQNYGIKPIIGCEAYIAPKSRLEKSSSSGIQDASYHFILLCKDEEGYHNLMRLVSIGYLEGFYYRPRIDKEVLSKHSKGLIGLTACLKGEIPQLLQMGQFNSALKCADDFLQIFGKDNFYLELQENRIQEQSVCNLGLLKIAKELDLAIVATNDVHYLTKETARAHEALLCIQTQSMLSDPKHMRFQTEEFYFKSPEEMKKLFEELPEAIANTIVISERCNLELDFTKLHLPNYEPQGGLTREEFLYKLCSVGIEKRFPEGIPENAKERLEHELKIIKKIGFTSYFLIVWDFIHYAKSKGIPVGPGRGSAAGSLVSYLLGITNINPLKYGLLFERFLNPERIGLPDIDIDFCFERRQEVIDYVTNKYGRKNVAQIITFGTMLARAVIRDVGRVMGMSYSDVDKIAKLVPAELNITLEDALKQEPELNNLYKNDPNVTALIDMAKPLEGLTRHASTHAAGVVISDTLLDNYAPLFKSNEDQITTGYAMESLEKIGLLKIDFLGLRTLTVIQRAIEIARRRHNIEIEVDKIPLNDSKTFQLLSSSQSMGVFQLESNGMRDLLKKIAPTEFEDLIAVLALYRPGPMGSGMLDDFIERRNRKSSIHYESKKMEPILNPTYGIMVYQEQVMQIASELAGFSLSQADLLRKAMAKKIPEVIERQRQFFVDGCKKNNIRQETANKIFDQIEYFSGYGFNKSHSAAYAMISYHTAYLKANYSVEFMAALLTSEKDNTDKIVEYVAESQRMGIEILPPDINESRDIFTVIDDKRIRFGLIAVKNVGQGAIEAILRIRDQRDKFKSLDDFCENVDLRLVNRKVIESLIKAGAMDSFGMFRAQLILDLEQTLTLSSKIQKEKATGQLSFFDLTESNGFQKTALKTTQVREWAEPQLLAFEKEMLGFYVTGHPLARFANQLKRFAFCSTSGLSSCKDGELVKLAGLISKIKNTVTRKSGEKMAILKLEDLDGSVEVLLFPESYKQNARYVQPNNVVLLTGRLNLKEETPKIIANSLLPIEEAYKQITKININLAGLKENYLRILKEKLMQNPGKTPVCLHLDTSNRMKFQILVEEALYVQPNHNLIQELETLIGEERFSLTL